MTPTRTQALGLLATLALTACSHDAAESAPDASAQTRQEALYRTPGRTLANVPERGMGFGEVVLFDGTTMVTGAPGALSSLGLAYTIVENRFTPGTFIQDASFQFTDAQGGEFGASSMALLGDTLVVGAPSADVGGARTGTSYVFSLGGSTPAPSARSTVLVWRGPRITERMARWTSRSG